MKKEITIRSHQIVILQTLLSRRFKDREERLHFVSSFIGRELPSTKNLTENEFFALAEYLGYQFKQHARFDIDKKQHRYLLSLCHALGWQDPQVPAYTDTALLGKWFCSSRNPFKKPLQACSTQELGKIIKIFETIQKQKYERR